MKDDMSDTFTTNNTAKTPPTSYYGDLDPPGYGHEDEVVPWCGNTYIIREKGSNQAITLRKGALVLDSIEGNTGNRWQCVERNGYFGFYNAEARVYIGHDGRDKIHAVAPQHKAWECFTPRRHPDGGYQLLSPFYEHTLKMISSVQGGTKLVRTQHGETLWEFVRV